MSYDQNRFIHISYSVSQQKSPHSSTLETPSLALHRPPVTKISTLSSREEPLEMHQYPVPRFLVACIPRRTTDNSVGIVRCFFTGKAQDAV